MFAELQTQVVLPCDEVESRGHGKHVEDSFAPTDAEYVPIPQSVHVCVPVDVLYFPATHREHAPPSGPAEPALQDKPTQNEIHAPMMRANINFIHGDAGKRVIYSILIRWNNIWCRNNRAAHTPWYIRPAVSEQ